ncbi:trypsin-like peptidase domain-containing protein [Aggregicoccus sp. 17bor-14]|uniref:S1 family peptidase n=1 Tax=Myxococcaceae TaxID=31 RepID=UPI00129C75AF|nr:MULTISPECIES: serine protease [Myxococcaceae]MBF5042935.1 trypsin-like peptidase domain-containing protein [Simulacricoccus sp. 17bor-14]MRI88701.1 trypsin-like peptidase domain-containing protein [Aggregicoccus sp. 17bor-14]
MTLWYLSRQAVAALLGLAVTLAFLIACSPTQPDFQTAARAPAAAPAADETQALREATLTLLPARCQGVVVEDPQSALTAAHCVGEEERSLQVQLSDGRVVEAEVARVDRPHDVAFLRLEAPAGVAPLRVASALPFPGAPLRFISSRHHAGELQQVSLVRLGRCPSLPEVPAALFTSLRGAPGDSGAPVVDAALQVVGLVHGGARCAIAAPTAGLAPAIASLAGPPPARQLARRGPPGR